MNSLRIQSTSKKFSPNLAFQTFLQLKNQHYVEAVD